MEIISLVISVLALAFSGWVYFTHDHKLKKQEILLNDLSLEKAQKELTEDKQACIFVEWDGRHFLFQNTGKADATNISASCDNYQFDSPFSKLLMHPGEKSQRTLAAGSPPLKTIVTCEWDDESGHNSRQYEIELPLDC